MGELIVVAGATGYAGRNIVAALAARGHRVRALVRSQERAEQPGAFDAPSLRGLVEEWRIVDFAKPETVQGVCEGADRVVSALGVTRQKADPWDIDFLGNLSVLEDAELHGLESFLYVNVLNVDSGTSLTMRSKYAFTQALKRSAVAGQLVNPSGYFSDATDFLRMAQKGIGFTLGSGEARFNPIHGEDLAAFAVDRMAGPAGSWDIGGPDIFSYAELEHLCFEIVGKRPRVMRVGDGLGRVVEWAADRTSPQAGNLARFFLESLAIDGVGEAVGAHRLRPYFEAVQAESASNQPSPSQ